jgi:exodeoxyribonuclease-3
MILATWNVNSIRARLPNVLGWLERWKPHVLCLQETKVEDERFPADPFLAAGYHLALHGERGRNGVAVVSRDPAAHVARGFGDEGEERRTLEVRTAGITVVTVYVPNGQAVGVDAYFEKIHWMVRLRQYLAQRDLTQPLFVCGDFNVAPEDEDIWDPRLTGGLHCTKAERDALRALGELGLVDLQRCKAPGPGPFTWWSYTPSDFKRDRGMRIDLVLGNDPVRARLEEVFVDREERGRNKASDHAPVVVRLS